LKIVLYNHGYILIVEKKRKEQEKKWKQRGREDTKQNIGCSPYSIRLMRV
jgi:hypothetical protein